MELHTLAENEISRRLHQALEQPKPRAFQQPPVLLPGLPRRAAVLIPFLMQDGEWHVLFTRRTPSLAEHSGQVAFPGGRADSNDEAPEVTALREAQEEIGLQPQDVILLGKLAELLTISNYCVTPVVGRMKWPYPLKLALDEVSRVFTIPLRWLSNPENYHVQTRELPAPHPPVPVIYFKEYFGELLWGVSAQITLDLIAALNTD